MLSVWPGKLAVNGGDERSGVGGVMEAALRAARSLPHRSDFAGWTEVKGRGELQLSLGALNVLAREHGMAPRAKSITARIEQRSSAFHGAFLRGLFDADGSVQGAQGKGVSIRLAQSDLRALEAVQRMLLRLGIVGTIYRERRPEGIAQLADGKGASKGYKTRAQPELVIAGDNIAVFAARVGFRGHGESSATVLCLEELSEGAESRTVRRDGRQNCAGG